MNSQQQQQQPNNDQTLPTSGSKKRKAYIPRSIQTVRKEPVWMTQTMPEIAPISTTMTTIANLPQPPSTTTAISSNQQDPIQPPTNGSSYISTTTPEIAPPPPASVEILEVVESPPPLPPPQQQQQLAPPMATQPVIIPTTRRYNVEVDPARYRAFVDQSNTRRYACSLCGNVYKWRKSLNKHWKEKHGDQAPPPLDANVVIRERNISVSNRRRTEPPPSADHNGTAESSFLATYEPRIEKNPQESEPPQDDDDQQELIEETHNSAPNSPEEQEDQQIDNNSLCHDHPTNRPRAFECGSCQQIFQTVDAINDHFSTQHMPVLLRELNDKTTPRNTRVAEQNELMHLSDPTNPLKCAKCAFIGRWPTELQKHAASHSSLRPYKCLVCSLTYKWRWDLAKHFDRAHTNMPNPYKKRGKEPSKSKVSGPSASKRRRMSNGSRTAAVTPVQVPPEFPVIVQPQLVMPTLPPLPPEQQLIPLQLPSSMQLPVNTALFNGLVNAILSNMANYQRTFPPGNDLLTVPPLTFAVNQQQQQLLQLQTPSSASPPPAEVPPPTTTINTTIASSSDYVINNNNNVTVSPPAAPINNNVTALNPSNNCRYCDFKHQTHPNVIKHMRRFHGKTKPFHCAACSYTSNWKWDVCKHVMRQHEESAERVLIIELVDKCLFETMDIDEFTRLTRVFCIGFEEQSDKDRATSKIHEIYRALVLSKHFCEKCPYRTNSDLEKQKHDQIHLAGHSFRCSQCSFECKWKEEMKKHIFEAHRDSSPRDGFVRIHSTRETVSDEGRLTESIRMTSAESESGRARKSDEDDDCEVVRKRQKLDVAQEESFEQQQQNTENEQQKQTDDDEQLRDLYEACEYDLPEDEEDPEDNQDPEVGDSEDLVAEDNQDPQDNQGPEAEENLNHQA